MQPTSTHLEQNNLSALSGGAEIREFSKPVTRKTARGWRSHRVGQRGAYRYIELAFVFLPLMCLTCGIADFSMVMYHKHVFQNAVNEAVRWGITQQPTWNGINCGVSSGSQVNCLKRIVVDRSMGSIASPTSLNRDGQLMVKVSYYNKDDLSEYAVGTINAEGNVLEVRVENFLWDWIVPVAWIWDNQGRIDGSGQRPAAFRLGAKAMDVMQGIPAGSSTVPTAGDDDE